MDVEKTKEYLKTEFGIETVEELELAFFWSSSWVRRWMVRNGRFLWLERLSAW